MGCVMKKVKLFLLCLLMSQFAYAESVQDSLKQIEIAWATAYYELPTDKQAIVYSSLLNKLATLDKKHPHDAGILYWQALIKAANAEHQNPLAALDQIHEVRDLLNQSIAINPKIMNGAAYVMLGTLYDKVPHWPIAFGDEATAKKMLEMALAIAPNGVESNYFYGAFLRDHDQVQAAESYFKKALDAPVRVEQPYPETQLKYKAQTALKEIHATMHLSQLNH